MVQQGAAGSSLLSSTHLTSMGDGGIGSESLCLGSSKDSFGVSSCEEEEQEGGGVLPDLASGSVVAGTSGAEERESLISQSLLGGGGGGGGGMDVDVSDGSVDDSMEWASDIRESYKQTARSAVSTAYTSVLLYSQGWSALGTKDYSLWYGWYCPLKLLKTSKNKISSNYQMLCYSVLILL